MIPAIFLDRDGVLTVERGYISHPRDLEIYSYASDCITRLHKKGFLCIVISNQSGVARGLFSEEELTFFHRKLIREVGVDDIYYCPHHIEGVMSKYRINCECRKPKIGMIREACSDYEIDMSGSWMVGDRDVDMQTGRTAGIKLALLSHGKIVKPDEDVRVFKDLVEYTDMMCNE